MIPNICFRCHEELTKPGGLLFSPPDRDDETKVHKFHLCVRCFNAVKYSCEQHRGNKIREAIDMDDL